MMTFRFFPAHPGRFFYTFLLSVALLSPAFSSDKLTQTGYRWPIDATRMFTSSFGELRPGRFHAGLDFSTGGNIGHPCFAIADGYISRIKVRHNGYGKAIYLSFGNGEIAVYAHLDHFTKEIEKKIYELQKEQNDFEIELFFKNDEYPVKRGDIIAYSGATGAGPPHLHFELRHGMTVPFNPIIDGFTVADNRLPVIKSVALIPIDENSEIDGDIFPKLYHVNGESIKSPRFFGKVGIAASVADFQDKGWYRLGAAEIEVFIDGELKHVTRPNSFKYIDQRQSRLHFNFHLERHGYRKVQNLFMYDQNTLDFYDRSLPGAILDTKSIAPGDHLIKIRATDFAGNRKELEFTIVAEGSPYLPLPNGEGPTRATSHENTSLSDIDIRTDLYGRILRVEARNIPEEVDNIEFAISPFDVAHPLIATNRNAWIGRALLPVEIKNRTNIEIFCFKQDSLVGFEKRDINVATFIPGKSSSWQIDENVTLEISSDDLWFEMSARSDILPREDVTETSVYSLRPYEHPFANPFKISFKNEESAWDSNAVVCYKDAQKPELGWIYLGRETNGNENILSATALSFEDFTVMIDSIPPIIDSISPPDGKILRGQKPKLIAAIDDTLSGINLQYCSIEVDGLPVIWEFDPDEADIFFNPRESLSKGTHQWRITVVDNVGNKTVSDQFFTIR